MSDAIRQFPDEIERVETGPIQFGQDWPGVFIRGNNAAWFAFMLTSVLNDHARFHGDPIARNALKSLASTLASCNLALRPQPGEGAGHGG